MEQGNIIVKPGLNGTLIGENGERLSPPDGWAFLAAGDAGITRKVTAKGIFWRVQAQMGRRIISKGIWAPQETIAMARQEVEAVRSTEAYRKKLDSDRQRRDKKQAEYEKQFCLEVRAFLAFAPRHRELEKEMAEAITLHAVPVGSGTVARTAMIPVEERAAKAVIAWMRHQTTAYESMRIPRIKGKRREVRRMLANRSVELLKAYRDGLETTPGCPLKKALKK
ncbi:MAG: DUF2293 domain-containing protein [Proteobacteria bacterium]|nr:DUF2293 domain-containing protein [Pseudomonadota bacterium]MBU4297496.1 DUF2293 domain-containing protein [Pseudomonadota bacterium]MCG2748650.1 DUF2293 domain-containing protein [Desulfobulbaceae bacterium]